MSVVEIIFFAGILIGAILAMRWQVRKIMSIARDIRDEIEKLNRRHDS